MMAAEAPRLIISTDLDGTLLDHDDYSWSEARPALEQLRRRGMPVIINSSKTFDEVRAVQDETGIRGPFIVENGSALFIPMQGYEFLLDTRVRETATRKDRYWQIVFGAGRDEILEHVHALRTAQHWRFEGFSDWSVAQIAHNTGLDEQSAARAAAKLFSEPIAWHDSEAALRAFRTAIADQGFLILKGGRFHHVQGSTDKGKPLLWLRQRYLDATGAAPRIVCLGDSENDVQMLNVADYPVCVRSPVSPCPEIRSGRPVIRTQACGPRGWNQAIDEILTKTEG